MRVLSLCLVVSSVLPCASAWSVPSYQQARSQQSIDSSMEQPSRRSFLSTAVVVGAAFASSALQQPAFAADVVDGPPAVKKSDPPGTVVNLPNGVSYTVIKAGTGPVPSIGELAAIRFAAYCGDIKLDDVFDTPEPYYTRVGSGGLVKGVEGVLPLMQVGDRWKLTIPGDLAFGKKGRPSSAGKPRVPADATIIFEVEMVGLPGKEPELIELIGDF